ncbi:hypothetical protein HanPSC8_Chr00c152g0805291 [Helianthus annuus]|nr:hypothetical protein HanPSC8_Chr00c152g0805291 [Helianthus annuus]
MNKSYMLCILVFLKGLDNCFCLCSAVTASHHDVEELMKCANLHEHSTEP